MRTENEFEVPVAVEEAWELFINVERVVPCMPGAELTEVVDERSYRGRANVRLGPIKLSFDGDARFEETDEAERRVKIKARGREKSGRGAAQATITSSLTAHDGGTRVHIVTDLQLSGPVAQYGRQGVVADMSEQLISQFADCLRSQLLGDENAAQRAVDRGQEVKGFSVALRAAWRSLVRYLKRLVGSG